MVPDKPLASRGDYDRALALVALALAVGGLDGPGDGDELPPRLAVIEDRDGLAFCFDGAPVNQCFALAHALFALWGVSPHRLPWVRSLFAVAPGPLPVRVGDGGGDGH